MRKRDLIVTAMSACLILAGCSSGDGNLNAPDGGAGSTPGATPTPSPSYASFPLKLAATFNTINAELSYTGSIDQAVTLGVVSTEQSSGRLRVAVDGSLTSGVFGVDEEGSSVRFEKEEATGQASPVFEEFGFRRTSRLTWGESWQLDLLNNILADVRTSNRQLQLDHASYAVWSRARSTTGEKRSTVTVWGYPTISSDLPTKGTTSYVVEVRGRSAAVAKGATKLASLAGTATVSIDFSTGQIDLTLDLSTVSEAGTKAPVGQFKAVGSYAPGQNEFTGSFSDGSPLRGTIAGGFFGASAAETGLVFALSGMRSGVDQRIVGLVVGKKSAR